MRKFVLAAVLVLMASGAQATALDVSPDVAIELGGATVQQQDVARDDPSGGAPGSIADLGSLPDGADVVGYHEASPTQQLFVLDVNADLGGTYASAGDVIAYAPGAGLYQIELDMSALGIPDGTRVDAFGLASNGDYILSFDVTVDLGGGLFASDEDLINYSLRGGFTMLLNGSNVGLDRSLDLDAASELDGNLLVSFDSNGSIGGIDFADEDVLSFDPVAGTWTHVYDGSAVHPGQWAGADLVAVPEPGAWSLLGAGAALLAGLARRKRKLALIAALLVPASAGMASDGRLEINQACAVNTGCFSGDTAGYPVTITTSGSYLLASNLIVPASTHGISATASGVSIDLNGFEIIGAACVGASSSSCAPTSGVGHGVDGAFATASAGLVVHGISVKNGSITGMGGNGLNLGDQSEVTNLRVRWNHLNGIEFLGSATVSGNKVYQNGGNGIYGVYDPFNFYVSAIGSVISGNTSHENGIDGIYVGGSSVISSNTVKDNTGRGIFGGTLSTISYNTAWGNGARGIDTISGSVISNNSVSRSGAVGIHTLVGATVSDNNVYLCQATGIVVGEGSNVSGNTSTNNIAYGLTFLGGPSLARDNALTSNGSGAMSITPGWVNGGGNYCAGPGVVSASCP